jgi:phosphatidylserine synthase
MATAWGTEGAPVDLSKLTQNQRVTVAGAIVAAISLFLPWQTAGTATVSSFDSGLLTWGGLLLLIAASVVVVLEGLGIDTVRVGKVKPQQLAFAVAALGLVMLVVWRIIGERIQFGLYIGLIAAVIVVYGTYSVMSDAGLSIPSPRDFWLGRQR